MAPWDLFVCQWQVTLQFQVAAAVLMVRSHLNLEWTCQGRLSGDQSEHRHFRPVEQAEAAGVVAQSPADHQGCPLDLVDAGVIPGEEAPAGGPAPRGRGRRESGLHPGAPKPGALCSGGKGEW